MQGFRYHGQDLIEFVKLLVPKSLKKNYIYVTEGILRRTKISYDLVCRKFPPNHI
jgi:hypothetical protein